MKSFNVSGADTNTLASITAYIIGSFLGFPSSETLLCVLYQ